MSINRNIIFNLYQSNYYWCTIKTGDFEFSNTFLDTLPNVFIFEIPLRPTFPITIKSISSNCENFEGLMGGGNTTQGEGGNMTQGEGGNMTQGQTGGDTGGTTEGK